MRHSHAYCLLFLTPAAICLGQNAELKPFRLNSGRVIFPKQAGPMLAPNMPKEKIWVFSYQTQLKIANIEALEREAQEVWLAFKPNFESVPGITIAILQADEAGTGRFIQSFDSYKFVIEHKPDGSWHWLPRKPK